MDNLDLLWEIQKRDNALKEIKNRLEYIVSGKKVKLLIDKLNKTEKNLTDLEFRLEENEQKLNGNNTILKELDFQLKDIEKDLYKGSIDDLKQLSYLDKEREIITKEIKEKETEILLQMEKVEKLKEEFKKIEGDFKKLRVEYTRLIKNNNTIVEELKKNAKEQSREINRLSSQVDEDVLKIYIQLKNSKGNPIVEVIDNKCNGCNMVLPIFIIDKLKDNNSIIYCENCNRILYLKK